MSGALRVEGVPREGYAIDLTARVAEVIFTATQFDNVDSVLFWMNGEPIEFLGGEGLMLADPQSRIDVSRELSGSVIVDMAAPAGGNCPLTEAGKTVIRYGVTIGGETNIPSLVAADSSSLYARNVLDFLKLVLDKEGQFKVDLEDDIVAACLMTQAGEVRRK